MNTVVRDEPGDVRTRLAELGLDEESLKDAVRRGQLAFLSCTPNHPRPFPGMSAWAETVWAAAGADRMKSRAANSSNNRIIGTPPH